MEKVIAYYDENADEFWYSLAYYDKLYKMGRIKGKNVFISKEEALYLLEQKKIIIKYDENTIISTKEFLKSFNIDIRYFLAIKDLRNRGYYLDHHEKFILIHEKGDRNNPKYLCIPIFENEKIYIDKILDMMGVAKKFGTKLLLAIIDLESDIVYYEIFYSKLNFIK